MNETERFATVRTKVAEVVAKATSTYGVDLSNLQTTMNIKGATAGRAHCRICNGVKQYKMQFNCDMILNGSFDKIVNDTVPHEVAHLVCFANPMLGRQHDRGWQRVCLALGGDGKRCHNEEIEYAHGSFDYLSDRGHVITVSKIRHQKIQAGMGYTFRGKGRILRTSPFCVKGGTMPTTMPTATPSPTPIQRTIERLVGDVFRNPVNQPTPLPPTRSVATGSMSKAEQVRMWIRAAKQFGNGQDSVIAKAIAQLSMSKSQAQRYVSENWVKV